MDFTRRASETIRNDRGILPEISGDFRRFPEKSRDLQRFQESWKGSQEIVSETKLKLGFV
eukprot:37215-Amorphochlora_amoeboformis.AAC.1